VLLSTYVCHPSLANDNLSGIVLLTLIGRYLRTMPLQHTYRLLFGPGTLGPLAAGRQRGSGRPVVAGLALSCVGDSAFTYKRSRVATRTSTGSWQRPGQVAGKHACWTGYRGAGRAAVLLARLRHARRRLLQDPTDACPANHSSADDLHVVSGSALAGSVTTVLEVVDVLETDGRFVNLRPKASRCSASAGSTVRSPVSRARSWRCSGC
jgi:aminopeptidase-like protein